MHVMAYTHSVHRTKLEGRSVQVDIQEAVIVGQDEELGILEHKISHLDWQVHGDGILGEF